ncbi:MAG: DUF3127 domain-containing protein [Candidatus Limimorpha sp.]
MEIIGKVVQLGTLTEGNSARGPWKKQELIIETQEQYPKKVCLICWNDRVNEANSFVIGQTIKAQISIESREYNGKWFTDIRPFRFDIEPATQQVPNQMEPQYSQPQHFGQTQPQFGQNQFGQSQQQFGQNQPHLSMTEDFFSSDNGDDLPF